MLTAANSTENQAIIVAASCSKTTGELTYCGDDSNGNLIIPENKLVQVAIFSGNCVLIPKFVYQKVGNIDPLFHHAIGDNDYALRALKKGIKSFIAPGFLAYCEAHDTLPKWCVSSVPFKERVLSLYSPLGHCHPYYFFRYELRHFGLFIALRHLFSINLRLLFPALWK
jgi:GT2 family glycosyltransferase